jgi:hypothetical protein
MIWVVIGLVVVAGFVALVIARHRRPVDGVTTFQRQIDALSPEARRRVVDKVQQADGDVGPAARRGRDGA